MTSDELTHVRSHWAQLKEKSVIYNFLLSSIEITAASHGSITARLLLSGNHINSKGGLHGAVSGCIVDWAGGLAIASTGMDNTGVSTDIHTTYVSSAKEGDVLEIVGKASKVGRTLAFTTVETVKLGGDGQSRIPVCNGTHTKYVKQ